MDFPRTRHLNTRTAPVLKLFFTLPPGAGSKPNKMKKELLLQTDILDIIFENRNKAYGAYNLRKYYDQRMNKAVGIM